VNFAGESSGQGLGAVFPYLPESGDSQKLFGTAVGSAWLTNLSCTPSPLSFSAIRLTFHAPKFKDSSGGMRVTGIADTRRFSETNNQ
jgi:hypothetical protein